MNDPTISEQTAALQHEIQDLERSLGDKRHRGLLRRILLGPIGRQAQREADVERAAARQDQARELEQLRAEQARQSHTHADLVAQARAREDEARRPFEAAQRDRETAERRARSSATDFDLRVASLEADLRRTADPRLADAAVRLEQIAREVTGAMVMSSQQQEGRPTTPETQFRAQYPPNDAAERGQLAREIRDAARAVQALALEVMTADELTARVGAIWQGLAARATVLRVRLPRF